MVFKLKHCVNKCLLVNLEEKGKTEIIKRTTYDVTVMDKEKLSALTRNQFLCLYVAVQHPFKKFASQIIHKQVHATDDTIRYTQCKDSVAA